MVPVKDELGSGLGVLGPVEGDLGVSLYSFSGGRSMHAVSTEFKGRGWHKLQDVGSQGYPMPSRNFSILCQHSGY